MPDKIDKDLEVTLDAFAQVLVRSLPDGVGFFLLCFEFNAMPGTKNFSISNAERMTLVAGLKQWIARLEARDIIADEDTPGHPRYRPTS